MNSNLVKARGSVVFIFALLCAFSLVWWIEKHGAGEPRPPPTLVATAPATETAASHINAALPARSVTFSADMPALPSPRALTPQEMQWARVAWAYFKNNVNSRTGLANSVDGYPAATMWDTGSYLLALRSARQINIISQDEFDTHLRKALASLAGLALFDDALPNKSYNVETLAMVDDTNRPVVGGTGWSALDIGRLLVPLNLIAWNYPQHTKAVNRLIARWDTARLVQDGQLYGARMAGGQVELVQEGRLGYEQFAAKSFALIGINADRAADYLGHLGETEIYAVQVPHDLRDARTLDAHNYVVSEPYVLDGLEFGGDRHSREFAWRIYRAQEERFLRTGVLTAATEDHVDQPPYFVYNTVFTNGKAWQTISDKGESVPVLRSLSVKAAFAWHALYRTGYSSKLMAAVAGLHDPARGWYAGLYEENPRPNKSLTSNTNAVVLESLAYTANGKQFFAR